MSAASVCHTTGKSVLPDRKTAQRAAKNASHRYRRALAAYRCDFCGGWHVGTPGRIGRYMPVVHDNHKIFNPNRDPS